MDLSAYKFVCFDSVSTYRIEEIPGTDLVRVYMEIERPLKNVTQQQQTLDVLFTVEEWGFPGQPSSIEECSYDNGSGIVQCPDDPRSSANSPGPAKRTNNVSVDAGSTIKLLMKGSEVHRNNGDIGQYHTCPGVNPIVKVTVPSGFKFDCTFSVPDEKINQIDSTYQLNGTQFPGQRTYIRWWK